MTLHLLINGVTIQTWDIPDEELSTPALDWETRTRYRIAAVQEWISKMERVYRNLLEGSQVQFQLTFASKGNVLEISNEEMQEFELLTIYKSRQNAMENQ